MPRDCPEIIYMYLSNMPFWGRQSWRLSAPFRRCECLCFWRGITSGAEFRTYSTNLCLVKMTTCLSTPILLPGVADGSWTILGQSCSITSATQICFPFDFKCTVKKVTVVFVTLFYVHPTGGSISLFMVGANNLGHVICRVLHEKKADVLNVLLGLHGQEKELKLFACIPSANYPPVTLFANPPLIGLLIVV